MDLPTSRPLCYVTHPILHHQDPLFTPFYLSLARGPHISQRAFEKAEHIVFAWQTRTCPEKPVGSIFQANPGTGEDGVCPAVQRIGYKGGVSGAHTWQQLYSTRNIDFVVLEYLLLLNQGYPLYLPEPKSDHVPQVGRIQTPAHFNSPAFAQGNTDQW
jgi:hypothetical protein